MDARIRLHALLCAICAIAPLVSACGRDASVVYVPGGSFEEELFLTTSRGQAPRVRVGEPLVLHAQRRSGPWFPVPQRDVEEGQCSLTTLPPQLEPEVAASVRWIVVPEGHATFDVGLREDGTREVRFDAPGLYLLTAESGSWCREPFYGDTLRVEVRSPPE